MDKEASKLGPASVTEAEQHGFLDGICQANPREAEMIFGNVRELFERGSIVTVSAKGALTIGNPIPQLGGNKTIFKMDLLQATVLPPKDIEYPTNTNITNNEEEN